MQNWLLSEGYQERGNYCIYEGRGEILVSSLYGLVSEICQISSKVKGIEQAKLFVMVISTFSGQICITEERKS